MQIIIPVLLSIALIIAVVYHIMYRRQVRRLCRQIEFVSNNRTEMKITTDIATPELKELVHQIENLNEKYKENEIAYIRQDAALRETITNLSHDIRTPLTSLDGYFQLLTSADTNPEKKDQYQRIIKSRIESLNGMLDELFTYAKLQDKGFELEMGEVDINALTADILMSFYDDITERGETPEVELPENPVIINGNKDAYTRVVQNIIKNALVHGKNLNILLKEEDGKAVFECSDELNNPETKIDTSKIFDRFYKADKARTNAKGSGLGLAITKELVERMGGSISADCRDGIFAITVVFQTDKKIGGNNEKTVDKP